MAAYFKIWIVLKIIQHIRQFKCVITMATPVHLLKKQRQKSTFEKISAVTGGQT